MSNTFTFIAAATDANDSQLLNLIRASFVAQQARDRKDWLTQIELGLDGYGDRHRETAARIRNVLRLLQLEPATA